MRGGGWVAAVLAAICACAGPVPDISSGPDASSGSGGGLDAGLPDAGAQAGGADGGAANDCEGVVPASLGSAYTFDVSPSKGSCTAATSDGQGFIAAETHRGGAPGAGDEVDWHVFDSNGGPYGAFPGSYGLHPQAAGFMGSQLYASGTQMLIWWGAGGAPGGPTPTPIGDAAHGLALVVPGAHGGAVSLRAGSGTAADALTVRKFDGSGQEKASATAAGSFTVRGGAEDAGGAVLAIVAGAGGALQGIWFDLAQGTSGAPFAVGTASAPPLARPLLTGGVVLRLDGRWTALVLPGDTALHAAPQWLRDGVDFTPVRAGTAYALQQPGSNALDLVSTQGHACGTVTFPGQGGLALGGDGTVIGSAGGTGCTKVFWRGLLK
jgi:hypothetical protein